MSPPRKLAKLSHDDFNGGEYLWRYVYKLFKMKIGRNPFELQNGFLYLLKNLLVNGCKSKKTVMEIMETYYRWLTSDFSFHNSFENISIDMEYILSPMLEQSKASYTEFFNSGAFFAAVERYEYIFASVLAKFGSYVKGKDAINEESRAFSALYKFFEYINKTLLLQGVFLDTVDNRAIDVINDLKERNGKMLSGAERGFHRCIFITIVLKAVHMKMDLNFAMYNYISCVQLLFDSTPEPLISIEEFQEFLQYLNSYHDVKRAGYNEYITEQLKKLFRNYHTSVYSPRTLKHLCRCEVRRANMNKSSPLPCAVENMYIPKSLKKFLLILP